MPQLSLCTTMTSKRRPRNERKNYAKTTQKPRKNHVKITQNLRENHVKTMSKPRTLDQIVADLRKGIGPSVIMIWLSTDKTIGDLERRIDEIRRCLADDIEAATRPPPRRNCDVGTPEEQIERHDEYYCCEARCSSIFSCRRCFADWAQMPYEDKPTTNNKQEESK